MRGGSILLALLLGLPVGFFAVQYAFQLTAMAHFGIAPELDQCSDRMEKLPVELRRKLMEPVRARGRAEQFLSMAKGKPAAEFEEMLEFLEEDDQAAARMRIEIEEVRRGVTAEHLMKEMCRSLNQSQTGVRRG